MQEDWESQRIELMKSSMQCSSIVLVWSRVRPRIFYQVGHQTTITEISTFSINNVIGRLTKIMNRADKNWAHF